MAQRHWRRNGKIFRRSRASDGDAACRNRSAHAECTSGGRASGRGMSFGAGTLRGTLWEMILRGCHRNESGAHFDSGFCRVRPLSPIANCCQETLAASLA